MVRVVNRGRHGVSPEEAAVPRSSRPRVGYCLKRKAPSCKDISSSLLYLSFSFSFSLSLQLGETCASDGDCDAGLRCETCDANGNTRARCTRIRPLEPTSKVNSLPFNQYSWLTTHNSYSLLGAKPAMGPVLVSPRNQEDSVTNQLNNGVRGLMLDMYDFANDIWLCHSYGGVCYNYTTFQPTINVLKEIQGFLEANPSEIITIFLGEVEEEEEEEEEDSQIRTSKQMKSLWLKDELAKSFCVEYELTKLPLVQRIEDGLVKGRRAEGFEGSKKKGLSCWLSLGSNVESNKALGLGLESNRAGLGVGLHCEDVAKWTVWTMLGHWAFHSWAVGYGHFLGWVN
ncbi:uncharacterized protein LOC131157109 [Malania oleifera]|uniref:uncharacterized protein LOC131157109 n=1 Tax=Malania oleifera TaxID=397392 RepID=UPI0025AEB683|nr:uncharacterized protein LOC131157109 [Malania oleifera]